ncbi:hypothetical protein BSNK01_10940 [Bacillaceae bacterium]
MARLFVFRKSRLLTSLLLVALAFAAGIVYWSNEERVQPANSGEPNVKEFHLVVVEYKFKLENGQEMEAYRWDPGMIVVHKGDHVRLRILGMNHSTHPFILKGYDVKGEVRPGKETVVTFVAERAGTFPLICLSHPDAAHEGPMIGYIEVLE